MVLAWLVTLPLYDIAMMAFIFVMVGMGNATVNFESFDLASVAFPCGKLGIS